VPGQHRRGRRRIPVVAVGVTLAASLGGLALALMPGPARPAPRTTPSGEPAASAPTTASEAPAVPRDAVPFARAEGIRVYLPAPDPVLVAYHEASYRTAAAMSPLGTLQRNASRKKFPPPASSTPGPDYVVMSSRGRPTAATSAADVVLPASTRVRAPVSGRVVQAKPYRLYGTYHDWRVEIAVAGDPEVHVVMIHLIGVRVRRGDDVSATLSVIGRPRALPFRSQVDHYANGGDPHVHIEVKKPSSKTSPPH